MGAELAREDASRRSRTAGELAGSERLRFVAQLGTSPAQYLIQARIDRAHQLLTETGMSVTQVASALGYTDVPYFSRQYKQRTGTTPRDARS